MISFSIVLADISFAVYMASDNSMVSAYSNNLDQMRISSGRAEKTKIHIFADTPQESYRFFIHDSVIDTISISSNVNSGDPKIISDFFADVFSKYPDDIKIAVIWDHGNGWYNFKNSKSVLFDNNPSDFISVTDGELSAIFEDIMKRTSKKTDIVIFDACEMQTLEVAYELSNTVEYMIASEYLVPYFGMPYANIIEAINNKKDTGEISKIICDKYYSLYDSLNQNPVISAIKPGELQGELKGMSFEVREIFSDIDSIDVSVNLAKSFFYNLSYDEKYKGIKLFYPADFSILSELYADYIKLKLDDDFNIIKQEFKWHSIPDTFNPLSVSSCSVMNVGNENYRVIFNSSYDFSSILEYKINYSSDYSLSKETFDFIPTYIFGDVSLSDYLPLSKPYSIFCKSVSIPITLNEENNVIELSMRGMFSENPFVVKRNGNVIYSNTRYIPLWKTIWLFSESGKISIEFNSEENQSEDYLFLDDLKIYGFKSINMTILHDTVGILHKMFSGNNILFIRAEDEYSNVSNIGELFFFTAEDSIKAIIYPNPASNYFKVKTEYKGEYLFNLYTSSGYLIASFDGFNTDSEIEIYLKDKNLRQGIYFYVFTIGSYIVRGKVAIVK